MVTLGIDVSQAQGVIDWPRVASESQVKFAIAKSTEGNGYVDPQFANNWRGMRAAGLIQGAYGFARPDAAPKDAAKEAEFLFSTIEKAGGFRDEDLPPALDIETAGSVKSGTQFTDWVLEYLRTLHSLCGRKPMVYTGGPFFNEKDGSPDQATLDAIGAYPHWLAAYVQHPENFLAPEWRQKGYILWQKSGDQAAPGDTLLHVPGIGGGKVNVDKNIFNGTVAELRLFIADSLDKPVVPAPPPATDYSQHRFVHPSLFDEPDDTPTQPQCPTSKSSQSMKAVKL